MNSDKEYYWVPEDAIFDSAADATEFMDLGAGCLVANHVMYDKLKADYAALKLQCEKLANQMDLANAESSWPLVKYILRKNLKEYSEWKEANESNIKA